MAIRENFPHVPFMSWRKAARASVQTDPINVSDEVRGRIKAANPHLSLNGNVVPAPPSVETSRQDLVGVRQTFAVYIDSKPNT